MTTEPIPLDATIRGEGIQLGRVRSKELGELMGAIEDMVAFIVLRDEPDLRSETIIIGLMGLKSEGVSLLFQPNLVKLTTPAIIEMIRAFATHKFETLPNGAIKAAASIVAFVKKYLCEITLTFLDEADQEYTAIITPATEVQAKSPLVGQTTLYGEIKRVGGLTPRVALKTVSGRIVYCDVSEPLAKKIGFRLYTYVAVQGQATWDAESWQLESFRIHSMLEYEERPLPMAAEELQAAVGEAFDSVTNVSQLITDIRQGVV